MAIEISARSRLVKGDARLRISAMPGIHGPGILVTMDAKQGVKAIQILAPHTAIPIHFNDYTVMKSPIEDFMQAIAAAGLEDRVRYLKHGDTYTFEVPTAV